MATQVQYTPHGSGSAVAIGAFVSIALIIFFSVFGVALGLSLDEWQTWMFIVAAIGIALPFLIGGFVTARWLQQSRGTFPILHGFAMWAVVLVSTVTLMSVSTAGIMGTAFQQLGLGAFATVGGSSILEQLAERPPSLVTDVQLKEGKAVTTLQIRPQASRSIASETAESLKEGPKAIKNRNGDIADLGREVKEAGQTVGWGTFGTLSLALLASLAGSFFGYRGTRVPQHP